MSSRVTEFDELISNELKHRYDVFCHGNSGSDSFCKIDIELRNLGEFHMKHLEECFALENQCRKCPIKQFLKFSSEGR